MGTGRAVTPGTPCPSGAGAGQAVTDHVACISRSEAIRLTAPTTSDPEWLVDALAEAENDSACHVVPDGWVYWDKDGKRFLLKSVEYDAACLARYGGTDLRSNRIRFPDMRAAASWAADAGICGRVRLAHDSTRDFGKPVVVAVSPAALG